jgi:hypothetical protein
MEKFWKKYMKIVKARTDVQCNENFDTLHSNQEKYAILSKI